MPKKIPVIAFVAVGGILDPIDVPLPQECHQVGAMCMQQRPDQPARTEPAGLRHSGQAFRATAARQVEEQRLSLVFATREPAAYKLDALARYIEYGASPRATIYLAQAAKVHAFMAGRSYVTPQDVKDVAYDVLRHRVILTYEAEAERKTSEDVIRELLSAVPVP